MPIVNSQSRHWLLCEYACGHLIIDLPVCVCVWGHLVTDLLCLCLWSSCSSLCALIALIRSFKSSFSLFSSWTSLLFSSSCLSNDCKRFCCFRSWEGGRERVAMHPLRQCKCVCVCLGCVCTCCRAIICVCVCISFWRSSICCMCLWVTCLTHSVCCCVSSAFCLSIHTHTHMHRHMKDTLDQTCLQRWPYAPSLVLLYFRNWWH